MTSQSEQEHLLPRRLRHLKSPITTGKDPAPDIKGIVTKSMDPQGEHAELQALRKEQTRDEASR
jgi:hypothetical protein